MTQVSRDEGAKWFAYERYATADHDYLRVKEVRGVRQGEGKFLRCIVENARGEGIAGRQRRAEAARFTRGSVAVPAAV